MTSEGSLRVVRDDAASRYELYDDAARTPSGGATLAGFAEFRAEPGVVKIAHTEIDNAFRGRGYGETLAEGVFADVVERDEVLWPYCPFLAEHLARHRVEGLRVHWPGGEPEGAATPGTD